VCNFGFSVHANFIDEVVAYAIPLDVCAVISEIPYLYVRDLCLEEGKTNTTRLKMEKILYMHIKENQNSH
jgi:hypothetical protein